MFQQGDTISRYRITGPLGRGGMGEVYQAEDLRLQRPVALKFLPKDLLTENDRKRFLNEAQAAAVIRHPNICTIYDVEEVDGEIFISMALLEGETLLPKIGRGPLPIREVIDIGVQIASGLDKAHELGIIHRDIKSNNIMVNPDGHVSILDFGLALRPGSTHLTQTGQAMGTPGYMAPEQIKGQNVDRRTDIWALGVVLYEMLTGQHPFRHDQDVTVIYSILSKEPVPVLQLRPDAPSELARLIEMALAKNPDRRPRTARDMVIQLRRMQESGAGLVVRDSAAASAPTQTMAIARVGPPWKRRQALWVSAGILSFVSMLGIAYYRRTSRQEQAVPAAAAAAPAAKQVAVLPFEVIGGSGSAQSVADGIVEVVTAALSDFEKSGGQFMVVPASEVRARHITSAEEAKRIYGVSMAITGSVQPAGGKLQFTVSTVDTAQMRQSGAKIFEYDPAHPVESKDRAVGQVAQLLGVDWRPETRKAEERKDSSAPGAYAAYLEGRGLMARYDVQGNIEKAITEFQRATEADPRYALAWAGLAEAYWRRSRAGGGKDLAQKAVDCAERAVRLEPGMAVTHTTLGEIYGTYGRESEAIRELKKAIELAPSNAEPTRELARIYSGLGRLQESEALYLQAMQARPTDWSAPYLLGRLYYGEEKYDQAQDVLRKALALAPDNEVVSRTLGAVYLQQGRYDDAIRELQSSLKIKSNAGTYLTLGATYFYQHRFKEAAAALETAIDLDSTRYFYWGNLGIYYKWAPGEEAKSAPSLQKAVELAQRQLAITPNDYDIRADLAEYRARLGDKKGALEEIAQIPDAEQQARASRLALALELTGNRAKAIELIRSKLTNPASLTQIKDDPDLQGLWQDPQFQAAIRRR